MDSVEDIKEELAVIATLLRDGFFGGTLNEKQNNLLVVLMIMKLEALSK